MVHYLKVDGNSCQVEFNCTHPDNKNNSTEDIGCGGECEYCRFCKATLPATAAIYLLKKEGVMA